MKRSSLLKKSQDLEESLINLTPLIDVVFVVLIAFILIAPLLEIDHVDLAGAGPSSEQNLAGNKASICIYVKEDDSVWLGKRPVSIEELTTLLHEKSNKEPDLIPQLFQDQKASFGSYQAVKNAVEKAGFPQLDVVLKNSK